MPKAASHPLARRSCRTLGAMNGSASRRAEQAGVAVGAIILLAALWGLANGIIEALDSGAVNVIYRRRIHPPVPWASAWAYFAGLALLAGAGLSFVAAALVNALFVLLAFTLLGLGTFFFFFSGVFSTVGGAAIIFGMVTMLVVTFLLNKHFGRVTAITFWAVGVLGYIAFMSLRG